MANNISGRVWTVDTVGVVFDGEINVDHFEFVNFQVATDEGVLLDRIGRNIWDFRGSTDFSPVKSGHVGWIEGLTLSALTIGSLGFIKVYIA